MTTLLDNFRDCAHEFCGKKCWNYSAGVFGSTFYLDFGSKYVSDTAILSPKTELVRGEFVITCACADWRIDDTTSAGVLASSLESNAEEGPILTALARLVGAAIARVELREPGLDCSFRFDNGLNLEIFAIAPEDLNYSLWHGNIAYKVGGRSALSASAVSKQL